MDKLTKIICFVSSTISSISCIILACIIHPCLLHDNLGWGNMHFVVMILGIIAALVIIVAFLRYFDFTYSKYPGNSNSNKNSASSPIVSSMACFALVISVTTVIYLIFSNYEHAGICFRYSDASVTVISIIVTILLGWNIYQLIDLKGLKEELANIDEKYDERFRKMVNSNDDTLGGIELDFARMIIGKSSDKNAYGVLQFVVHILQSMYYYSRTSFDNSLLQLNECSKLFNDNENSIRSLSLNQEQYNILRRMLSRVKRQDEINDFDKIQNIITDLSPKSIS